MAVVDATGAVLEAGAVRGPGRPDMAAVDDVARWALRARRRGARLEIRELCPELAELIELAGLPVEVQR